MSERVAPWIKFYPADFMNGVRGMSAQEVGLYQMLLCRIYEENGPVEFNVLRLATYCGMREATFTKTFEKLVALGKLSVVDGWVSNARAEIEISNRANDLKIASRAGKASAQKRQQNQHLASTPVQRTFNHTDTDTDTDTDKKIDDVGDSACDARDDFTLRERILDAIGIDPVSGLTGQGGRMIGTSVDMAEVDRWKSLPGMTDDRVVTVVRECMPSLRSQPPKSFKYFTPAMQQLSAQLSAPALQPATIGTSPPPEIRPDRYTPPRSNLEANIAKIRAEMAAKGTLA